MRSQCSRMIVVVPLIVMGVIAMAAMCASAQALPQQSTRPPVPPPLREEIRTPTPIVSRSAPDCPVMASGQVALGQTTSGQGLLALKNVSGKPIAAISGMIRYETTGGFISYPWYQSFLGSIAGSLRGPRRYFTPGEETSVPMIPLNVTQTTENVRNVTVSVMGVLFADGTVWGTQGETVRKRFLDQATASRYDLQYKVLPVCKRLAPRALEQEIKEGPIKIGQRWLNRLLQKGLLNQEGQLRPDALERLKKMIANLEHPLEQR